MDPGERERKKKKHMRAHTHTHTHTNIYSVQYPDCFLFLQCLTACLAILCRFLSNKWHVTPILAVSWQPHFLLPHIWEGCCAMFWYAFVTKDCKQSQSSFELMQKAWSPYSTVSSSSRIYIFHLYMAHTSVSTTLAYCLQSKTSHSPVCHYHSTLYTKWEDCNHSTVSVSVSIIKQWMAGL